MDFSVLFKSIFITIGLFLGVAVVCSVGIFLFKLVWWFFPALIVVGVFVALVVAIYNDIKNNDSWLS